MFNSIKSVLSHLSCQICIHLLIRPLKVLVKSGLNSEQVSLMRPIYIEKCILVKKQVVLIARVVLILCDLTVWRENVDFGCTISSWAIIPSLVLIPLIS